MLDIVLMSPKRLDHYRPPLWSVYLGGYLKAQGLSVAIGEYKDAKNIGISCMSSEYEEVKRMIKSLRWTKANIIVGGIHPTLKPNDFKGLSDTWIRGEAEVALYETITKGLKGEVNGSQYPLDEICFPDYSLIDMDYYSNANPYAIRGVYLRCAYIGASRGCPSSCTFCVAKSLRPWFGCGRFRSVENVWTEINHLRYRYQIDGFYLIDDLFTLYKDYVLDFCSKSNGMLWGCNAKVSTLDEDMIKAMAKAGCIQIDVGVERGSDKALRDLKKGQTIEQVKKIFALCKKYGIRTFANFLINIPGETGYDLGDIVILIKQLRPSVVSVNVFQSYLGTELQAEPSEWADKWAKKMTKKYNSIWNTILFHLSWRWIKMFLRSKRKKNYIAQLGKLFKETMLYV